MHTSYSNSKHKKSFTISFKAKMSTNASDLESSPHIALIPTAGMGHLRPFLRLAEMLSARNCLVTLISATPRLSEAESTHISSFISTHPQIKCLEFQVIPVSPANPNTTDPFFLQYNAVCQSAHLLRPLLSSLSPPLSAIFSDLFLTSSIGPIAHDLCIPNYVVSTTSAKNFCLMTYLPILASDPKKFNRDCTEIQIPGLDPFSPLDVSPLFWNKDHLFTRLITQNARFYPKADGIIINTYNWLEPETLDALNNGRVLENFPKVLPVGPFDSYKLETNQHEHQYLQWLDEQPAKSVVYVSFGSRTTMKEDQIRELGAGLESSKYKFLWVLKTKKVDKYDTKDMSDLLGNSFLERISNQGMIVKPWVNQEEILAHPAIGGFVTHCGWNSSNEAAWKGVPILAWPQHGDQRFNAEVMEKVGLGIWERGWGWGGEKLVTGVDIGRKIRQLMEDESLRSKARKVQEEAMAASGFGGSSDTVLTGIIDKLMVKTRK